LANKTSGPLLRANERPTIEKIRIALGGGSPNTINPLLDTWWKRLSARLDAGPAALHRRPESVAHVAEALWMQALDEGRQRAQLELKSTQRSAGDQQQALKVRSHVLSLREGELDARLRDRESTISELNMQLRELTLMLRKEQATRDALVKRITTLETELATRATSPTSTTTRSVGERPLGRPRALERGVKRKALSNTTPARRQPAPRLARTKTRATQKAAPASQREAKLARRPKPKTRKKSTPKN
jgi:uncharacterized coiled-coil protein SlyX